MTGLSEDHAIPTDERLASTELWLIRHGESAGNAEGRLQGQADFPLTPRGLRQAEAVAMRLRGQRFTALYSSDLSRALDTACIIGTAVELLVETDPRLREIDIGVWSGLTGPEIAQRHGDEWGQWSQRRDPHFRRGGGESYRDLTERVAPAVTELVRQHPGERVLIVSHGGTINAYLAHLLGMPLGHIWKFAQDNAGINRILPFANPNADPDIPSGRIVTLNDTTHLDGLT